MDRTRQSLFLLLPYLVLLIAGCSRLVPAASPTIRVLDLRFGDKLSPAQRYDVWHAAACIQGLANRDAPRVFLIYHTGDEKWLGRLREPGGLCEGWGVSYLVSVDDLVSHFRSRIKGLILYDADLNPSGAVCSTSLAATTAAACEDAIAIRKDLSVGSLYSRLSGEMGLPVLKDLTGKFTGEGQVWDTQTSSTGSAKCDVYLWALDKYLLSGRCDPTVLSYTLDLWGLKAGTPMDCQLSNLDYAVAKKGFCFELSPWGDEKPNDDAGQPLGTDQATFRRILDAANARTGQKRMVRFCGFTNWQYKYTDHGANGRHGAVETEWETVRLVSAYNAYLEADAPNPSFISNGSFYAGLKPALDGRRYVQNPAPTRARMLAEGLIREDGSVPDGNYILLSMGDYDQASWTLYELAGNRFDDPVRGQVKCNWGVDPNAMDRASVAIDYMYRHRSPLDTFTAWDSGAGYINPKQLYGTRDPSNYPSGVEIWRTHCRKYYRFLDYSISGWLLNGMENPLPFTATDIANYAPFSGDGVGLYALSSLNTPAVPGNVPVIGWGGDLANSSANVISHPLGVHFAWYRTVLWRPSDIKALEARYAASGVNHRFLTAYEFYYLLRHHLGGKNEYRATWISDTIPRIMEKGKQYEVKVVVRNDGWDTWSEAPMYRLAHAIVPVESEPSNSDYDANPRHMLPDSVNPGTTTTLSFSIMAPQATGRFALHVDMVRDGVTWFHAANNIEWKKDVIVAEKETDVDTDGDGAPDVREEDNGRLYWHPDDAIPLRAKPDWMLLGSSDKP